MGLPWFSHESRASRDSKMRKLLMKYGAEGYGMYWYVVEHVADNVGPKLNFEVEHDSEILAYELKINTPLVEEMMLYMIKIGLFERHGEVITCFNLLKHLSPNCTRNERLKTLIKNARSIPMSQTVSDSLEPSEIVSLIGEDRIGEDKKNTQGADAPRESESKSKSSTRVKKKMPPTIEEVQQHLNEKGITSFTAKQFCDHYEANGWMRGNTKIKSWQHCVQTWVNKRSSESPESRGHVIDGVSGI